MLRLPVPLLAVLVTAGCGGPQNYVFGTAGPAAAILARLGWEGLAGFSAASVITLALIGWLALRRRGSLAEHAPIDANRGQSWILVGGFAIPFAVLAFLFVRTVDTMGALPLMSGTRGQQPDIIVTGHQWWFQVDYPFPEHPNQHVTTATEIHVPAGQPMTIQLQSVDVIHSFWVPKLHGKVDMIPGQKNFIRIQADEPGTYLGECAEYCGQQHAHMRLMVVAESQQDYHRWLEHQRADAETPKDALAQQGEKVFLASACALCHRVRGTRALGEAGPELTHIGSRLTLAGGALANTASNLGGWAVSAQNLKPGAQMPSLTTINGQDLRALVAYLRSLK